MDNPGETEVDTFRPLVLLLTSDLLLGSESPQRVSRADQASSPTGEARNRQRRGREKGEVVLGA